MFDFASKQILAVHGLTNHLLRLHKEKFILVGDENDWKTRVRHLISSFPSAKAHVLIISSSHSSHLLFAVSQPHGRRMLPVPSWEYEFYKFVLQKSMFGFGVFPPLFLETLKNRALCSCQIVLGGNLCTNGFKLKEWKFWLDIQKE